MKFSKWRINGKWTCKKLLKYDGLIDAVSRSYGVRREDSNEFYYDTSMIQKAVSIIFLFLLHLRFPRYLSTIKILRMRYGDIIVRKVRVWETTFQILEVLPDIDFLNTCLKNNIIPKFKLIKQEISNKKWNLRTLRRDLTLLRNELSLKLNFIDLNPVCNLFLIGNDKAILKHKQFQNKKLNNLRVTTLRKL